ncbi:MAG: serine protease [Actinobacteria bacterium]|nr:serine protease [Actinomycetota bacterium]
MSFGRRAGTATAIVGVAAAMLTASPGASFADSDTPTTRVIGGSATTIAEWPAIAALVERGRGGRWDQFCGGTLIAPKYVLTAAHCVIGTRARNLNVVLGRTQLSTSEGEQIAVKRIIRGNYKPKTDKNDIALLRLRTPSTQEPMRILRKRDRWAYQPGRAAQVAGWGATKPSGWGGSDVLRSTDVNMVSTRNCKKLFRPIFGNRQICAGVWPTGGCDSCNGDSGGPLTVMAPDGRRMLAGLVSFGANRCASKRAPAAVYTRTSAYNKWIKRHTG